MKLIDLEGYPNNSGVIYINNWVGTENILLELFENLKKIDSSFEYRDEYIGDYYYLCTNRKVSILLDMFDVIVVSAVVNDSSVSSKWYLETFLPRFKELGEITKEVLPDGSVTYTDKASGFVESFEDGKGWIVIKEGNKS